MANINKIKPPKKAVIDLDSALFLAASAAEQVTYTYKDVEGNVVAEFDNARAGKNWIEEVELFGMDTRFGYTGDMSKLTREVTYKVGSESKAYKAFDTVLDGWLSHTKIDNWAGKVAAMTGRKVFRHDLATIQPYKGSRNSRKPHHLNSVRKYAMQNPNIKRVKSDVEVDDVVMAIAEKKGSILVAIDKDAAGITNGWWLNPDTGTMLYADPNTLGWVEIDKGKLKGIGYLHNLAQILTGDTSDSIKGLPKYGPKKAVAILEAFNNQPVSKLPRAVKAAAEAYREVYGDEYSYPHWNTGEIIVRDWKDMFEENTRLVWMLRHSKDKAEKILDHLEGM